MNMQKLKPGRDNPVPTNFQLVADGDVTVTVTDPDGVVTSLGKGRAFRSRLRPGSTVAYSGNANVFATAPVVMRVVDNEPSFTKLGMPRHSQLDAVVMQANRVLRENQRLARKLEAERRSNQKRIDKLQVELSKSSLTPEERAAIQAGVDTMVADQAARVQELDDANKAAHAG